MIIFHFFLFSATIVAEFKIYWVEVDTPTFNIVTFNFWNYLLGGEIITNDFNGTGKKKMELHLIRSLMNAKDCFWFSGRTTVAVAKLEIMINPFVPIFQKPNVPNSCSFSLKWWIIYKFNNTIA